MTARCRHRTIGRFPRHRRARTGADTRARCSPRFRTACGPRGSSVGATSRLRSSKTSWSAAPAAKNSTADRGVTEAARAPPPTCVVRRAGCLRAPRARARRPSVAASPDRGARRRSTTALVASADNRRASRPDSLPALRLFQRLDRAAAPSVSLALTATDSARSRREASTVRSARRHRCRASSASRRQVSRMAVCASTSSVECIGRRYSRPAQLRTTRSVPFAGRGADTVYRTADQPTGAGTGAQRYLDHWEAT
jgi:hypothetical protein